MSEDTIHPENSSKYEALKVKKGIPQPEAMNPNIAARLKNIRKKEVTTNHYVESILKGNINCLSQASTLLESTKLAHQTIAKEVINCYLPSSGHSIRIDITK